MLQQEQADDFVIATGRQFSVRDFANAVAEVSLTLAWQGQGVDETGIVATVDQNKLQQEAGNRQGWRVASSPVMF